MGVVFPSNILQTVQTYQPSALAYLENLCPMLKISNSKFKEFNTAFPGNLGSSVSFDLPPRMTVSQGLVAAFQPAIQRVQTLTCDQSANASIAVTAQDKIFNLQNHDDYMKVFGKSQVEELANQIEINLQLNCISGVTSQITGQLNTTSGPYRFFGDGSIFLSSYQQIAEMIMLFRNYGAVKTDTKVILPDTIIPTIIGTGLNQFVPQRNEKDFNSWELGSFGTPPVDYYASNLLPIHVSGNTGVNAQTLTVVSVNDPTGQNVTQMTLSGATNNDLSAVFTGDRFQFKDNVSGQPNMRYLTFIGHTPSANAVQIRATAPAQANGSGQVTITFTPALNWAGGGTKNLNNPIAAGMQLLTLPSHRAGMVVGGDGFFVAMPALPDMTPFPSSSEYDETTGVSMRMYYGATFGKNEYGLVYDATWGSTAVPEYTMAVIIPLAQG